MSDLKAIYRTILTDPQRGSDWIKRFELMTGLKVWQAAQLSGSRPEER